MTFLWHAALYTCAVYGAITLTVTFAVLTLICVKARRPGKRRDGAMVVAGAEALLKDAAGGGR